jgi:hypothetical protein
MKRPAEPGHGVDAQGGAVIDPTENVIALVEANKLREDDLRSAEGRRVDSEIAHVHFVAELRAAHSKEMRESEAKRLDAIRQVDVAARTTEAERATAAIEALAKTTAANAETLRSLVTSTATALAASNAESNKQQLDRISALERSSYMGAGKDTGKTEGSASIRNAILFAIAIAAFALGSLLPLLRK